LTRLAKPITNAHMKAITSVCVYCGSSTGRGDGYLTAGRRLGNALAQAGIRLVYGGGTKGIMGAVAAGCLEKGGKVTGIIPRFLIKWEATENAHTSLDDLIVTEDMHQRKHLMFDHSDAFIALPGGIGTVEEIVEIMTWAQLGRHEKPIVFANIDGFWAPLMSLLEHMRAEGFIHTGHRVKPLVIDHVDEIVPALMGTGSPSEGDPAIIERL
jgi:uncharacterized protein (TIGR00730 family)